MTTTICDELKIATNFKSKIVGISLKDRGGILPAGHSANAAYWYDNSVGKWITSTYYMNELPTWVNDFNDKKLVDKYYEQGWGYYIRLQAISKALQIKNHMKQTLLVAIRFLMT